MEIEKAKKYGVSIRERKPTPVKSINLSGPEGHRIIMEAAKRVIETHKDVVKALANR